MAALPPLSQVAGAQASTYEAYWKQADTTGTGAIGALDAASFLKRSGLKQQTLSEIWDLSDPTGRGYLDKQGFFIALKLISLAQSGLDVNITNLAAQSLAPKVGDIGSPAMTPLGSGSRSGSISGPPSVVRQRSMSGSGPASGISAAEKVKYDQIFDSLQPVDGILPGDKVKPVFMNSKLKTEILGRVWELSDIDKDGCLDRDEFAVAMHLIYRALDNEPVPPALPPTLIPAGKRSRAGSLVAASLPGSVPVIPASVQNDIGKPWVVSAQDRVQYDVMFKKADLDMDGLVSGLEIKDIFIQSGLPQPSLAHIWNLCDMHGQGKLTCEQFALAMHLVQQQLKGLELPQRLTPEMVPPSMRKPSLADGSIPSQGSIDLSGATSGCKELDALTKEIEDLKLEKLQLERDKAQKDADMKIRTGEVQILQKELDSVTVTVNKLETQKGEAQKRLDDLDEKRSQLETHLSDLREKCSDTQRQVDSLRSQIAKHTKTIKNQEEDLDKMRADLNALRSEEVSLSEQVRSTQAQLRIVMDTQKQLHMDLSKAREFLQQCNDELDLLQSDSNLTSTSLEGINTIPRTVSIGSEKSAFSADVKSAFSEPSSKFADSFGEQTNGMVNGNAFGASDSTGDVFAADPFGGGAAEEDPFGGPGVEDDPFRGEDPFGGEVDAFGAADAVGPADPFEEAFSGPAAVKESDPFQDAFESAKIAKENKLLTLHDEDAWDPFGDKSSSKQFSSSQSASDAFGADPFGTDPFIPGQKKKMKNGAGPILPPKSKKAPPRPAPPRPAPPRASPAPDAGSPIQRAKSPAPPRPPKSPMMNRAPSPGFGAPSPAFGAPSPGFGTPTKMSRAPSPKPPGRPKSPSPALYLSKPQPDNFANFGSEPFGAQDPFLDGGDPFGKSSAPSAPSADDAFNDFADFGSSKSIPKNADVWGEDAQIAWAKQESERLEEQRLERQKQELADLELALALSRSDR